MCAMILLEIICVEIEFWGNATDADNREVLEYDGASGAIQRWYTYGLGSNDLLGQMNVAASTRTMLIPDIQGSFIATLDSGATAFTKAGFLA